MTLSRWRAAHPGIGYQASAIALPDVAVDAYIARTYVWFFSALLSMAVVGLVSYRFVPRSWMAELAVADGAIWILCGWFGWRRPVALAFPLFSAITGLFLGQLAHLDTSVFLSATVLTLMAFGGLSLFVHITGRDFSFLRGFLSIAFFVLLGGWILSFFFQQPAFLLGWTGFGVLVFGCWILFDTSEIINRADADLTPGVAAFELFLDIIGFHRWLLDLLLGGDGDGRHTLADDDEPEPAAWEGVGVDD